MKFMIGGVCYCVLDYGNGTWCYEYDNGCCFGTESPSYPESIKPSIEHFTAWILPTITQEPPLSNTTSMRGVDTVRGE
jgi:hypothetical protein